MPAPVLLSWRGQGHLPLACLLFSVGRLGCPPQPVAPLGVQCWVGGERRPSGWRSPWLPRWAILEASTRGRGRTSQGLYHSSRRTSLGARPWVKDRPHLTFSKPQPLEQSQPSSQSGLSVALARSPNGPVPQSPPPLVLGLSSVRLARAACFPDGETEAQDINQMPEGATLAQQAVGSEPGLLGPQRPQERLGGTGAGGPGGGEGSCHLLHKQHLQAALPAPVFSKVRAFSVTQPCLLTAPT